jgi:hypothetical protein
VGSPYARGRDLHLDTWEFFTYQRGAVSVFLSSTQRHRTQDHLDWKYVRHDTTRPRHDTTNDTTLSCA